MMLNIFEYLENTARRLPEKAALVCEKRTVSFAELYEDALSIGRGIAEASPLPSLPPFCRPVFVMTARSADCVLGFLGALASGNFYVPIDTSMPAARMEKIFRVMNPSCVVGTKDELDAVSGVFKGAALIDSAKAAGTPCTAGEVRSLKERRDLVLDIDPAYVFFTSGSTGEPKGIAVSHANLIDFTEWYTAEFSSCEDDICANQPPFYFDASGRDLFPCLKTGGTIHILSRKYFMFPALLVKYLNENRVNVLNWATAAFSLTAQSGILEKKQPGYVKRIVLGGEALQARDINVWKKAVPNAEIVNVYGPTETTVDCCFYRVDREFKDGEPVPIGKPCRNMQLFAVKEDGSPAKAGESGELYIRGAGVSNGYYADFEKSSASFVQDPLNPWWNDRVYITGDIVKLGEDGNFYFLCRKDSQIKHMGYRIELGEAETALSAVAGIAQSVCIFDALNDKIVCVYSGSAEKAEIASALSETLPKYMHPNVYVRLQALPMNRNGKVDRALIAKEYGDGKYQVE